MQLPVKFITRANPALLTMLEKARKAGIRPTHHTRHYVTKAILGLKLLFIVKNDRTMFVRVPLIRGEYADIPDTTYDKFISYLEEENAKS